MLSLNVVVIPSERLFRDEPTPGHHFVAMRLECAKCGSVSQQLSAFELVWITTCHVCDFVGLSVANSPTLRVGLYAESEC